MKRRLQSFEAP